MRRLATNILLENRYSDHFLGAILSDEVSMLIDSPLRVEDGREWQTQVAEFAEPRYLVLMDYHPDRVLGARGLNLSRVASDVTRDVMSRWPDTFKGAAHPIGVEADSLRRITGVRNAVPHISFKEKMLIHLGDRRVHLLQRPGPSLGAIWIELPEDELVFIGDAISLTEPPYIGEADLEAWLESLDELRKPPFDRYRLFSSRDGLVEHEAITEMARFVRKIPVRLRRMEKKSDPISAADSIAARLLADFEVPSSRRAAAALRLSAGLERLFRQAHPDLE